MREYLTAYGKNTKSRDATCARSCQHAGLTENIPCLSNDPKKMDAMMAGVMK